MPKTLREYTIVSIEPNMISHLWYGDSLEKAKRIQEAYKADGIYTDLMILCREVTAWGMVEE